MFVGEVEKRAELEVGGAPFGEVRLVLDGDGYAGHAGGLCGYDAMERLIKGEALLGGDGERLGAIHIDLGMWLAIG